MNQKPPCCIVYTTDREYLFPTLVSAIQARHHASPEKADVVVFLRRSGRGGTTRLRTRVSTRGHWSAVRRQPPD